MSSSATRPGGTQVTPIFSTGFASWESAGVTVTFLGEADGLLHYSATFPPVETDTFFAAFEIESSVPVVTPQTLAEVRMTVQGLPNRVAYNFLSVPVQRPAVYTGVVHELSGSNVTPDSASWNAGVFEKQQGNAAFFLEVVSGESRGMNVDVEGSTSDSITLANSIDAADFLSVGDEFVIRPHWTLDSLFGSTNAVGLRGGSSNPKRTKSRFSIR